jgi:hypothetical protein
VRIPTLLIAGVVACSGDAAAPPVATPTPSVTAPTQAPPDAAPSLPDAAVARGPVLPAVPFTPAQPVTLGTRTIRAEVCAIDPTGEPLMAPGLMEAIHGAVVDATGLYFLDQRSTLRRYRIDRSAGCALVRDLDFGAAPGAELDLKPTGTATLFHVATSPDGVLVSGYDDPRRVAADGTAWSPFCPGVAGAPLFTSPGAPRGYYDDMDDTMWSIGLAGDACKATKLKVKGAAKHDPELEGLAGDVLVVGGYTDAKKRERARTFHALDGTLLARAAPDAKGSLGVAVGLSACGPLICMANPGLAAQHEIRVWSRRGDLVGDLDLKLLLGAPVFPVAVSEHAGTLWVIGGYRDYRAGVIQVVIAALDGFATP